MRKRLQLWLQTSMILSLLDRMSSAVYRMLREGFFGRLFTAYSHEETLYRNGLVGSVAHSRAVRRTGFVTRFRLRVARSFENSFFLHLLSRFSGALLSFSLRVYGLFFSSFGLYVILIYLIKRYALSLETASDSHFLVGVILLVTAIPLLTTAQPLAKALLGSALLRQLLVHAAGIPRERLENRRGTPGRNNIAFILGMLFGALTYFVSPLLMLAAAASVIVAMIVFVFPEVGVLSMISLLPYLSVLPHPSIILAAIVLLTTLSYLFKLLLGKRVFHLHFIDVAVLLFLIAFLSGGLVSFSGSGSLKTTAIYVCLLLGYFLVVNLIRTRAWLMRCVTGVLISAGGVALYGIWQNFFGVAETKWIDTEMFSEINGRVVSLFENPNMLADYLIMLIPLSLAVTILAKSAAHKAISFAVFGAMLLCLVYTWSRGAWLGILFGLLLFGLLCNRRTLSLLFLGVFALPFVPLVLPESILSRLT
ncbi:MAG: hypothetical protein IKL84_03575, partial [Clostridia bacterium]|nr:hypothetical protein [Clostridia bacterium]